MGNKTTLTKILAILGTVLTWLPVLAPVLFSAARFIQARRFRFDYLMPAELFPLFLAGGLLLLWAAARAHSQRGIIGWSFGIAIVLLFGSQVLAVVTGLASGETEPAGLWWAIMLGAIIAYALTIVVMGVGGIFLLRDLFKPSQPPPSLTQI